MIGIPLVVGLSVVHGMVQPHAAAMLAVVAYKAEVVFFISYRRRHTILQGDWSSDVCSSDLVKAPRPLDRAGAKHKRAAGVTVLRQRMCRRPGAHRHAEVENLLDPRHCGR